MGLLSIARVTIEGKVKTEVDGGVYASWWKEMVAVKVIDA